MHLNCRRRLLDFPSYYAYLTAAHTWWWMDGWRLAAKVGAVSQATFEMINTSFISVTESHHFLISPPRSYRRFYITAGVCILIFNSIWNCLEKQPPVSDYEWCGAVGSWSESVDSHTDADCLTSEQKSVTAIHLIADDDDDDDEAVAVDSVPTPSDSVDRCSSNSSGSGSL